MNKTSILLSVIIPCKNEEKNIERCLRSVLSEIKTISEAEVLVIDSRSTDKSIEIAKQFPVNIIQLKENYDISPSSARYAGCLNTKGIYRFFIDADMELLPGFLAQAINFMKNQKEAGAVAGFGCEVYSEGGRLENMYKRKKLVAEVDLLAGAALFKSEALETAGYFNPFLKAEEEHEIAQRLKKANYKLYSIPVEMIKHYTTKNIDNFERRLKAGMFKGIGQMFRLTLEAGTFSAKYFMSFKLFLVFLLMLTALIVSIVVLFVKGDALLIAGLMGFMILMFLISCYSKRGIKNGILSMYKWFLLNMHILTGMFERTPHKNKYPNEVIVIKKEYK